jgi:hypothetical protein
MVSMTPQHAPSYPSSTAAVAHSSYGHGAPWLLLTLGSKKLRESMQACAADKLHKQRLPAAP